MSTSSPPIGSAYFVSNIWESLRDSGIMPLNSSALDGDPTRREEFLQGASLLRLHGSDAWPGKALTPQNLRLADALNAPNETTAILVPRRASKTTTVLALAMGRVQSRPGYLAAFTAMTTGLKARDRFERDVAAPLESQWPDRRNRPFRIVNAPGRERVEWQNGSMLAVLPPKGSAFRSDSWDLVIADEAGEASPEATVDVLAGAMSTMDTRPGAQFVAAGTAGVGRRGNMLWDLLELGRAGAAGYGIVEYAAPPSTSLDDLDDWATVERLVLAAHPGIGTLTDLATIKRRWEAGRARPAVFAAEYLSIFGQVGSTAFIDQTKWAAGADTGPVPASPPALFTIAVQVHPDSTVASVVAAWRTPAGRACLLPLYAGPVSGLHDAVLGLHARHRPLVAYDSGSAATDSEAQRLARARPRPRLEPQRWADVSTAASLLVKEIEAGNVTHWGTPALTNAVKIATKRGTSESKRWAYGRPNPEDDITALEAASIALRAYDAAPPRAALRPVVS